MRPRRPPSGPAIVELDDLIDGLRRSLKHGQTVLRRRQDELLRSVLVLDDGTPRPPLTIHVGAGETIELPLIELLDRRRHRIQEFSVEAPCELVKVATPAGARLGLRVSSAPDQPEAETKLLVITLRERSSDRSVADSDALDLDRAFDLVLVLDDVVLRQEPLGDAVHEPPAKPKRARRRREEPVYLLTDDDVAALRSDGDQAHVDAASPDRARE